jgi:acyl-coenzyme A synthetase/AMP-(fatty) acid ligase
MLPSEEFKNRILANVEEFPGYTIFADADQSLTWIGLQRKVYGFDKFLEENKQNNRKVCFLTNRGLNSLVLIATCLLTNRIFIPIDPKQPKERILSILNALGESEVLDLDQMKFVKYQKQQIEESITISSEVCYILFTSGSTGVPKGVIITYENIMNTLLWSLGQLTWEDSDVIGLVTNLHFDISIFDVLIGLHQSIKIQIINETENFWSVARQIEDFKVTSIFSTPFLFIMLQKNGILNTDWLRRIISGGDFYPPKNLVDLMASYPELEVFNVWGPTETTIVNTMHRVQKSDIFRLNEGKPISVGTSSEMMPIAIVNPEQIESLIFLGPNTLGEIVVLGNSVSAGYIDVDSGANANFSYYEGQRVFRTGDLGYLDESGELFIVGRSNFLIKYQGYRIDPREVEFIADKILGVFRSCLCLVENSSSLNELQLLVQLQPEISISVAEIKNYLRSNLLSYMVPKKIVFVQDLPMNSNGKLDRKSCYKLLKENSIELG